MLHTLQIIFYSFMIIFIFHYLYNFYNDNLGDKTKHNIHNVRDTGGNAMYNLPRKIQIHGDTTGLSPPNDSESMKKELQSFLKSQIPNQNPLHIESMDSTNLNMNMNMNMNVDVGATNIDDIPITA